MEGLNPRIRPETLAAAHTKGRDEDFAWIGADLSRAFDHVSNVINSEFVLFKELDVGSCLMEVIALPRDCHAMHDREI